MAAVFAFGKRGANNSAPVSNYLISKGFEFDGVKVGSRLLSAMGSARSGPSRSAVPIDREQSFRLIPIIRSGITISLWTGANGTVG